MQLAGNLAGSPPSLQIYYPVHQHPAIMRPRGLLLLLLLPALAWAADEAKPGLLEANEDTFETTLKQLPPDQMVLLECYAHWQVAAAASRRGAPSVTVRHTAHSQS